MRAYRRLEVLARGGMGSVERVELRDGRFRRVFARKRLLDAYRDDAEVREMFLDEARLAGLIRHPNVVSVVDVGEDRDGPFLVMELVEGVSLGELAASCSAHGPLPLAAALTLAVQVADGLRAAHELRSPEGEPLGLIHRDLTPGNVLVGFDGLARITDFGIAKAAGQSSQTRTGVLKGKPSYMAPEQLRFRPIDQRADLFAFGCVLYELLAGKRLYPQKGIELPELVRRIVDDPTPDLHDVRAEAPDALVELLFELLAKEPEDRPASAADVGDRLREILRDVVDEHGESSLVELLETRFGQRRVELETRRHGVAPEAAARRSWVAVALGVGALVAVGVGVWLSTRAEEEAAQVAPATEPAIAPSIATAPDAPPPEPESVPEPTMPEPTMPEAPVEAANPAPERPATSRRRRPATASAPEAEGIRRWGWEESP